MTNRARDAVRLLALLLAMVATPAFADWAEQIPSGSDFPQVDASDQHGKRWLSDDALRHGQQASEGDIAFAGTVFLFNRSTVW
ncbi:MAG: hypothetical protein KDI36_01400 [Pseudomonadales bacterium]|nr:hypothetical protein [Pseudomonadales bacterium]